MKNRNLKINNDLIPQKSDDFKLTTRTSRSIRDRLAKQVAYVVNLVESHWVGKGMCNQCQEEIDPFQLSNNDISLIKTLFPHALVPLSAEQLKDATGESTTLEQDMQKLGQYLRMDGVLNKLVEVSAEDATWVRDKLTELTENIQSIRKSA